MFKRMLFVLLTASLALAALNGCTINVVTGSGKGITQPREVSGFNQVVFGGLGELTLVQGNSESLVIEAEDNILARIRTEVKNGVLTIGFDRENWQDLVRPTKPIKYTLAFKNLKSLALTGAGSAQAESLNADALDLSITGAGNINIESLQVNSLEVNLGGAGNIHLAGTAASQKVTLGGLGNYGCGDLQSKTARITLTGAGSATVWAADTLDVTITGAGNVGYYNSPKITKNITGLGVLNSLGDK